MLLWQCLVAYIVLISEQISGRRRFNIISPGIEARIGAETVGQVQQEYKGQILPDYDPRVLKVKKVLERLIPYATAAGLYDVNWEVHVIDSPEQNAFVAPGYDLLRPRHQKGF